MDKPKPSRFIFGLGFDLSTALRATEAFRPEHERICDASFDVKMLSTLWRTLLLPGARTFVAGYLATVAMGTPGMLFCRTRFIDDALTDSLANGLEQVVCLGAGFDTRAYRIPGIERTRFFELDLPTAQSLKRERIQKALGSVPDHVTFVPIDFERQSIKDEMAAAGFRPGAKTFFIWEGVIQYITAGAVEAVLSFAATTSPGSQIAFTYIRQGIIDGSARSMIDKRIMSRVERRGMPWVYGLDPAGVEAWLARQGFRVVDHAGASDYRARYLAPAGRQMTVYEGERIVLAEVAGSP